MNPQTAGAGPLGVSLSSYGASEVRRLGQAHFARLAIDAGADGVEVRGELLPAGDDAASAELDVIAALATDRDRRLVYSSPDGLWTPDGRLDTAALRLGLARAARLGARRLKMSIGGYGARPAAAAATLPQLADRLAGQAVELLIENDQTPSAGTLAALAGFVADTRRQGLALGLTFDLGNWHWQGECPLQAAQALAPWVRYVHCKGVQRQPQHWVAVPLAASAAPWRAALRALPDGLPWAIEYPLAGDDLVATTRRELAVLRAAAWRGIAVAPVAEAVPA